ncbi:MAG: hypothetical protein ACOX5T_10000 [Candidatus Cryptobacteroides sp.]
MTNTDPACRAFQGVLRSATPARETGVANTDTACRAFQGLYRSATPVRVEMGKEMGVEIRG